MSTYEPIPEHEVSYYTDAELAALRAKIPVTTENDNREAAYTPELDVIRERAICGGRVLDDRAGAPWTTASVYGAEFDRAIAALSSRPSPATDEAEVDDVLRSLNECYESNGLEYSVYVSLHDQISSLASRPSSTPTPAAIQVTAEKLEREAVDSILLAPTADEEPWKQHKWPCTLFYRNAWTSITEHHGYSCSCKAAPAADDHAALIAEAKAWDGKRGYDLVHRLVAALEGQGR